MQLPQELQHFPHGALLVIADHMNAKFYFANGDLVDEVATCELHAERKSDAEGFMSSTKDPEIERVKQFAGLVATEISKQTTAHPSRFIHLVMPADLANLVKGHLDKPHTELLGKELHGDYSKQSILDVVKLLTTV